MQVWIVLERLSRQDPVIHAIDDSVLLFLVVQILAIFPSGEVERGDVGGLRLKNLSHLFGRQD